MAWTSSRIKITVWALASLFLVGLLFTAGMLAWTTRQTALENRVEQVTRFVSGAEAALNSSFLTIDLLLSGSDDLLGLSASMVDWVDTSVSGKLLDTVTRGNLLVSHTALLDREGRVLASSDAASARNAVQLPPDFLQAALSPSAPSLLVSAPTVRLALGVAMKSPPAVVQAVAGYTRWVQVASPGVAGAPMPSCALASDVPSPQAPIARCRRTGTSPTMVRLMFRRSETDCTTASGGIAARSKRSSARRRGVPGCAVRPTNSHAPTPLDSLPLFSYRVVSAAGVRVTLCAATANGSAQRAANGRRRARIGITVRRSTAAQDTRARAPR